MVRGSRMIKVLISTDWDYISKTKASGYELVVYIS